MRLLALLLMAQTASPLRLELRGLRSNKGRVGCALFDSKKAFPSDEEKATARAWCDITERTATCDFGAVAPGTYAAVCFHDENGNTRLDTGLFGIPIEGIATSRDARGFMGPPKFDDAKFEHGGDSALKLTVRY
jgi:uncharacterized protein (DUF2141 family)